MTTVVKTDQEIFLDKDLVELARDLASCISTEKRLELLKDFISVEKFFSMQNFLEQDLQNLSLEDRVILYSLVAIDQIEELKGIESLIESLRSVERFYFSIGGIVGYHVQVLQLINLKSSQKKKGTYHPPQYRDLSKQTPEINEAIVFGIKHLDQMGEIYPLGGAADRLALRDEETGKPLPAAMLEFCGKALIEHLIVDLQAREFLHFKLFGKTLCTPIAMMTSGEKGNHDQMQKLLKEKRWFGRKKSSIQLFSQPLVPAMNKKGQWLKIGPSRFLKKPGGHGVIWKLAQDAGILDWFLQAGRKKVLVRQINNLIAGTDFGLAAFEGVGLAEDKGFGFFSCPRLDGVSEGINVIIERDSSFCLTNIEYCDFKQFQVTRMEDVLANTNTLFIDIELLKELTLKNPCPGMLVNAKVMKFYDESGKMHEMEVLRLESTMQNIADSLTEANCPLEKSFITKIPRKKAISAIKQEFAFGASIFNTPEKCYLDSLENARELLTKHCDFELPTLHDEINFFINGPSFIFFYHPALGPFYSVIKQKIRGGRLARGSELLLEIADVDFENLDVDGSLFIHTESIMGHCDNQGQLNYSDQTGKCCLKNVRVRNAGINREASHSLWKNEIVRKEVCEIFIEEGGEFYAEDVVFSGNISISVPSGVKVTAALVDGSLTLTQEVLDHPSWRWDYFVNGENQIELKKSE